MKKDKTGSITTCDINTARAATTQHSSLRKKLTCLFMPIAILAIGQVYADYTVTYQYTEPIVTKEFDRYGGEFDYTFEKKTYTAPTIYFSGVGGIYGTDKVEYSFSHSTRPSWVSSLTVDGVPYLTRTLYGVSSSSTLPKVSFSIQPHVTATFGENTTSAERTCIVTNTLTIKSYPVGGTQATTSYFHWYCVFKQEAGSATVTVTLDSNGGTDAQPNKSYPYVNGGRNLTIGSYPNVQSYNTGYKQTSMQLSGGVTDEQRRQYLESFVMPTTTRAGYVFDGWWTVSSYADANNIRISDKNNVHMDGVKPTAKVTTIIAHWLFEPPHNFTATSNLTDSVSLSWEPVAGLGATYGIYRSEDDECPGMPIWEGTFQVYDDTSAEPGKSYYYWVKAKGEDNGLTITSDDGEPVIGMRAMEQVAAPTITPADGTTFVESSKTVSLECATQGASIYYTTDGTMPDKNSSLYTAPFAIMASTTIKAVAHKDGMRASDVAVATITKIQPLSLNDALDTNLTISTGGAAEWIGARDSTAAVGNGYAKSGAVGNRQSAWLSVTVNGKGVFSFWWRVSCEGTGEYDCDVAVFSALDADVLEIKRDGIMSLWEKITMTFATAGDHVLTWTYKKDKSDADGDDCLYLDGFSWVPAEPDPVVWTVTFDKNYAGAGDSIASYSVTNEMSVGVLPTPTREGYTFAGWWTESNGGVEITAAAIVSANMTLYAHWSENPPPTLTYTDTTPVPVRHDWLAKYSGILTAAGNDYEAAAMRPTGKRDGKGNALCVWHDYVAGTDPTNLNSRFRAKVDLANGTPVVKWEPDLNEDGTKSERFYKVFGKKTLATNENWTRLADESDQKDYNFFKVTVNIEETPDTEEELRFGDGSETGGGSGDETGGGGEDCDERPILFDAPYKVSASGERGSVWISWRSDISYSSDSSEWVDFCIYRASVNDTSKAVKIKTLSEHASYIPNSCQDFVDDCDTYYYWVRIETETARSEFSDCASAAAMLGGPGNLMATSDRTDGVMLSWDAVKGAASYKIYADDANTVNGWVFSREVGETAETSFFDEGAIVGATVIYKVVTLGKSADEYSYSTTFGSRWDGEYVPPTVSLSTGSDLLWIYWKWIPASTGYEVYRSDKNDVSTAQKIADVSNNGDYGLSYRDSSADVGKVYYYWMKTIYADGESGYSQVALGGATPNSPGVEYPSMDRTDGIEIKWSSVEGATSYRICRQRCNDNGYLDDDYVEIGTTTETYWLDTTVAPGLYARYEIFSVSPAGVSRYGSATIFGYRQSEN